MHGETNETGGFQPATPRQAWRNTGARASMTSGRSSGGVSSLTLPIATAALAVAIFIADIHTPLDVAIETLYVVVVLMAARFCQPRGVVLVTAGCVCLTWLGFFITPLDNPFTVGVANTLISLTAIGLSAVVVVRGLSVDLQMRAQARLLDLTHDSVFSRDMNHMITYWNRASEELLGWTKDEALGKVSHELLRTTF